MLLNATAAFADSANLHKAIHTLLETRLLPLTIGAPGAPEPDTASSLAAASPQGTAMVHRAWACLATVTRGLAMRGHPAADGVLAGAVGLLREEQIEQVEGSNAGGAAADMAVADMADADASGLPSERSRVVVREAARLFGEVLSPPAAALPSSPLGLTPEPHVVSRPLWQQRLYTVQSAALLRALSDLPSRASEEAAAAAAGAGASAATAAAAVAAAASPNSTPAAAGSTSSGGCPPLLLALAHLIRGAPAGVLRHDWPRMLPWVARCLGGVLAGQEALVAPAAGSGSAAGMSVPSAGGLAGSSVQEEGELAQALLGTLCEALMAEEGEEIRGLQALPCFPLLCLLAWKRKLAGCLAVYEIQWTQQQVLSSNAVTCKRIHTAKTEPPCTGRCYSQPFLHTCVHCSMRCRAAAVRGSAG